MCVYGVRTGLEDYFNDLKRFCGIACVSSRDFWNASRLPSSARPKSFRYEGSAVDGSLRRTLTPPQPPPPPRHVRIPTACCEVTCCCFRARLGSFEWARLEELPLLGWTIPLSLSGGRRRYRERRRHRHANKHSFQSQGLFGAAATMQHVVRFFVYVKPA